MKKSTEIKLRKLVERIIKEESSNFEIQFKTGLKDFITKKISDSYPIRIATANSNSKGKWKEVNSFEEVFSIVKTRILKQYNSFNEFETKLYEPGDWSKTTAKKHPFDIFELYEDFTNSEIPGIVIDVYNGSGFVFSENDPNTIINKNASERQGPTMGR